MPTEHPDTLRELNTRLPSSRMPEIRQAITHLGKADEIGQDFAGFQRYLYQQQGVA